MFSKNSSNQTGDLAVNVMNRGGGLLMGRSKEEYHRAEVDEFAGEQDELAFLVSPSSEQAQIQEHLNNATPIVRYSHIKTALVNSLADLDNQIRQMEFRNVFRLSYNETIISEETPSYYFIKAGGTSHSGNLYLSQNFLNFCSLGTVNSSQSITTSMLFESSQDPSLIFTVPYSHIVSLQKQSPVSLAGTGKLSSLSFSGYLVIATKNRYEFCISFSSVKARDRVSDMLLSRIKTVDWNFDDDVIIGGRNGPLNAQKQDSPTARKSMTLDGTDSALSTLLSSTKTYEDSKPDILLTGLNFLITEGNASPAPLFLFNDKSIVRWAEYFDAYGKDVCIVKDMSRLRELIVSSNGVPDLYRGDFWMLVSGAWTSRPEKGYYESLLLANTHRVNPFAEEIEKDVRRFVSLTSEVYLNIQPFKAPLA
jgi:hypothetical protein